VRRSKPDALMSALGHKRTLRHDVTMSALPPKADIGTHAVGLRYLPHGSCYFNGTHGFHGARGSRHEPALCQQETPSKRPGNWRNLLVGAARHANCPVNREAAVVS